MRERKREREREREREGQTVSPCGTPGKRKMLGDLSKSLGVLVYDDVRACVQCI